MEGEEGERWAVSVPRGACCSLGRPYSSPSGEGIRPRQVVNARPTQTNLRRHPRPPDSSKQRAEGEAARTSLLPSSSKLSTL